MAELPWKIAWKFLKRIFLIGLPQDQAILPLDIYPKELKLWS